MRSPVSKSLHLQRRELPYLPSAGRVPTCFVATLVSFATALPLASAKKHDATHQFGERLLEHVEEHGAKGWRDCVQRCGSHTCCKTSGGLSIVPVKEIFTSQVGSMDQLTGSGIMMLGSSRALLRHTLKS